jgi:hypothetical protein
MQLLTALARRVFMAIQPQAQVASAVTAGVDTVVAGQGQAGSPIEAVVEHILGIGLPLGVPEG